MEEKLLCKAKEQVNLIYLGWVVYWQYLLRAPHYDAHFDLGHFTGRDRRVK